jgi:RNA polymerase sigma factor (sigma-70 family)
MARNLAIDWLRRNLRRRTVLLGENRIAFDPIDEDADPQVVIEREYVRSVLARIEPPVLRDVLVLYTIRGYSRAEIAHLLGYAEGTVTTYLSQARKQFWRLHRMMDHTDR